MSRFGLVRGKSRKVDVCVYVCIYLTWRERLDPSFTSLTPSRPLDTAIDDSTTCVESIQIARLHATWSLDKYNERGAIYLAWTS